MLLSSQVLFWLRPMVTPRFSIKLLANGRYQLTQLYDVIDLPHRGQRSKLVSVAFRHANDSLADNDNQRRFAGAYPRYFNTTTAGSYLRADAEEVIERVLVRITTRVEAGGCGTACGISSTGCRKNF
jgi:hypothetical protein